MVTAAFDIIHWPHSTLADVSAAHSSTDFPDLHAIVGTQKHRSSADFTSFLQPTLRLPLCKTPTAPNAAPFASVPRSVATRDSGVEINRPRDPMSGSGPAAGSGPRALNGDIPCTALHCEQCEPGTAICAKNGCEDGFIWKNGQCVVDDCWIEHCGKCDANDAYKCLQCERGYFAEGATQCLPDKRCPPLNPPTFGKWTVTPDTRVLRPGTKATLSCNSPAGIVPRDAGEITCSQDGTWTSDAPPTCSTCTVENCDSCVPGDPYKCAKKGCKKGFVRASEDKCVSEKEPDPTAYCCHTKFGSCHQNKCPEGSHVCRNCRGLRVVTYPKRGALGADKLNLTHSGGAWLISSLKEHFKPWLGLWFFFGRETDGGMTFESGKIRRGSELVAVKPPRGKWESDIDKLVNKLPWPRDAWGRPVNTGKEMRLLNYFDNTQGYSFAYRLPDAGPTCSNSFFQCLAHGKNPMAAGPSPGCLLATMCKPGEFCCCAGKASFEPCSGGNERVSPYDRASDEVCKAEEQCIKKANSQECLRRTVDMTAYVPSTAGGENAASSPADNGTHVGHM